MGCPFLLIHFLRSVNACFTSYLKRNYLLNRFFSCTFAHLLRRPQEEKGIVLKTIDNTSVTIIRNLLNICRIQIYYQQWLKLKQTLKNS